MNKLLLIGCGPHARNFYFPAFARQKEAGRAEIAAAVDLESQRGPVAEFLSAHGVEAIFVPPSPGGLADEAREKLDKAVGRLGITGAVVSTDPLNHKFYAEWAVGRGLHLLLDKPITTQPAAALEEARARAIEQDYLDLRATYDRHWPRTHAAFIVCAHRRYHPGIDYVIKQARTVSTQTGCPVTNIYTWHCDGQWRLPHEMVHQSHHSYYDGHGKVSHSGYHFLDCVMRFWRAGMASGKRTDDFEVISSFVRPRGFLRQLTATDYERLFGAEYATVCEFDDAELHQRFGAFGEIDAEILITFRSDGEPIGLATISLLHNGFSRRSWLRPGKDLYKGNGRVKHEQHRIQVGPFLEAQIHSYQAKDKHEVCGEQDSAVGGNNHFEIMLFRNSDMIGGSPLEILKLDDLGSDLSSKRLHIDQIKEGAVREFVAFMHGEKTRAELKSDISDHLMSVRLMSSVYLSHARRLSGVSPLITARWEQ